MGRFDRYMLGELMKLFGFFGLILVSVYWINRAVILFDQLISDGQSALVFLEFTALSLPNLIRIVLPLASFAAALYVTNRLTSDSEMVVVQATGYSALRLARAVVAFGLCVTVMMLVLTHVLTPVSQSRLQDRQDEIARNLTARLLTPGQFTDAGPGVTVYIRNVARNGELEGVFLSDRRDAEQSVTYTARRAYLVKTDDGPRLVMIDGRAQTLRHEDQRLFVVSFADFSYNVGELIPDARASRRLREIPTPELLNASPALQEETGRSPARLQYEGHSRFNQATLSLVSALLGFAPLMLGGFSRFGLGRQMILAVALVILVMGIDGAGAEAAQSGPGAWPLTYLGTAVGLALSIGLLLWAQRGFRPTTDRATGAAT